MCKHRCPLSIHRWSPYKRTCPPSKNSFTFSYPKSHPTSRETPDKPRSKTLYKARILVLLPAVYMYTIYEFARLELILTCFGWVSNFCLKNSQGTIAKGPTHTDPKGPTLLGPMGHTREQRSKRKYKPMICVCFCTWNIYSRFHKALFQLIVIASGEC